MQTDTVSILCVHFLYILCQERKNILKTQLGVPSTSCHATGSTEHILPRNWEYRAHLAIDQTAYMDA